MDADPALQLGPDAIASHDAAYDSDDSDGSDKSDASVDSDDSGRTIYDGEDDDGREHPAAAAAREEQREREQAQHVNRVVIMRNCVIGKHWYADEEAAGENEDADKSLDAYGAFDADDEGAERMQILARAVQEELDKEWSGYDPEYGTTYEEELMAGERNRDNPIADVTAPLVHAHNPPPSCEVCFCCKAKVASCYQTPEDLFRVCKDVNPGFGIECVKAMAQMLVSKNQVEVRRRTACCRTVCCMLGQNVLKYECYEAWLRSPTSRTQLERGTDRKDQGLTFGENIIFLRTLAVMRPPPLTREELFALFEWLVLHAQWIQEREKRFIATAMAVANNPHLFGYTFADKQRFVDRMGSFVRKYALNVIFPHIMDTTSKQGTKWYRWKSTANCLMETGMPKAPDVVFALLCEDNWAAWGEPRDANGRYEHRVPRGNPESAKLFTREGFEEALTRCTHTKTGKIDPKTGKEELIAVKYRLNFASEAEELNGPGVAGSSSRAQALKLHKKIAGSHRKLWTVGTATAAAPTCGSAQANSGVHPRSRNENCWRAFDHSDQEAKAKTDLYMQDHENGNSVGHEKQSSGDKSKSKACTVIRPITVYVPPPVKVANATRALPQYKCMNGLIAVRPSKRKL